MKKTAFLLIVMTLILLMTGCGDGEGDMDVMDLSPDVQITNESITSGGTHYYKFTVSVTTPYDYTIKLTGLGSDFKWTLDYYTGNSSSNYDENIVTSLNSADGSSGDEIGTPYLTSSTYLLSITELDNLGPSSYDLIIEYTP